ncbi:PREDICTED: uncharacterized protein LOC105367325 [Ceratosolen solmsi marchali]|uniref:Uncharacterized protein LOC105367325 n=1 Tax=Ceratosolen solmsi marchali TaxID=326594 RepID=A0AAJ6YTR2_9HYME|nr:PREDICTED: uncharacterized protein LOC105367325 [Ceratosolen solmsi marchali]
MKFIILDVRLLQLLSLLLLLLPPPPRLEAVTVVDHHADNEYVLEHEVPYEKAITEARGLKLYSGLVPGCKACSKDEMTYCQNGSVLEDHCCCDGGYNEVLGFVEHKCRVGPEACKVRAADCAEYSRLRECCCHSYLASLWKYLAGGAGITRTSHWLLGCSVLLVALR